MTTSRPQVRHYRYVSGWCSAGRHGRCQGIYAGTACACPCHALEPGSAPEGLTERPAQAPAPAGEPAGTVA